MADYNNTLLLPKTDFPMRADLPQKEPIISERFISEGIYKKMREKNKNRPLYVFHDGPPYANGDIHLGHSLNKILKDFVVKYKAMSGYNAPFIPGWDTHGLPIENQTVKKLGVNRNTASPMEFRKICREFAEKYAANQNGQFRRLGVFGDFENPYYTLHSSFEAKQIEIFAAMLKKGYIYKGLKPVYWCPKDETALAEAEIEYGDDRCDSIYVKFEVTDDKGLFKNLQGKTYMVIWTTTAWTLPGNVAISVGPSFTYAAVSVNGENYIVANELVEQFIAACGITDYTIQAEFRGDELEYIKTAHPFLDRTSVVITGEHVTIESGTGCVHTAPGHGAEDYIACLNYKEIPIIVPVDSKGRMTAEAGDDLAGIKYSDAHKLIMDKLAADGNLLAVKNIAHQYPHCWRCDSPIIFRATEQWFCSIDGFRDQAIKAISEVKWIPAWGEDRMISMVRDRNDWCISRQRNWGVPIPAFYCNDCGKLLINENTLDRIANMFEKEGSDAWYKYDSSELLEAGTVCECGCGNFKKETDIMDVWFDSGVSHTSVLDTREDHRRPADLYLEGHDQYRGWFQSSLLTSVAVYGTAPYKTVVTHGFCVDGEGKKMSKSLGNGVDPADVLKEYGADILRLWVSSADYQSDIRISKEILKQLSEIYRKIRNTMRFILGNLGGFDPDANMVDFKDMLEPDKYALIRLNKLVDRVNKAYEDFEYHVVYHSIHNFCVVDMSNYYLDTVKDRLYTNPEAHISRRSAQSATYLILDSLVRLLAPVLTFTCEETWQFMAHRQCDNKESVFLNDIPTVNTVYADEKLEKDTEIVLLLREDIKKALENARAAKVVGASLEAQVILSFTEQAKKNNEWLYNLCLNEETALKEMFIVSAVKVDKVSENVYPSLAYEGISIEIKPAGGTKCERCWIYGEVNENTLCPRCQAVIETMAQ